MIEFIGRVMASVGRDSGARILIPTTSFLGISTNGFSVSDSGYSVSPQPDEAHGFSFIGRRS